MHFLINFVKGSFFLFLKLICTHVHFLMVFYDRINIRKLYPLIIFLKKTRYIREISRCKYNMAGKFYPVMKVLYRYYKLKSWKWKKKVSILYQYASVDCTWKSFQKYSRIENILWFQIGIGIHVHDLEFDNSSLTVDNKFCLLDCWSL